MRRRFIRFWICGILALGSSILWANPSIFDEEPAGELERSRKIADPESLIGLTLQEVFTSFGPPIEVGVVRGDEPWQDDVVFIYPEGLSLFWFQNRVWQVRLSLPTSGEARGIRIGDSSLRVWELLGSPYYEEEDWALYHVFTPNFPLRLRFFFKGGAVEDIYIYRGDF